MSLGESSQQKLIKGRNSSTFAARDRTRKGIHNSDGLGPSPVSEIIMEFNIYSTWNNEPVDHPPVNICLSAHPDGCQVSVKAPFFNSPSAPSAASSGQPCPNLWDFEVVETFFLNDRDQYVEVELCPHGQHLVLLLNGCRNPVQDQLPLDFKAHIAESEWFGTAVIPFSYFPPSVTRFNAFAIHGAGSSRQYESLYPATEPHDAPDFHRLEYFQRIQFENISSVLVSAKPSALWVPYT